MAKMVIKQGEAKTVTFTVKDAAGERGGSLRGGITPGREER